MNDKQVEMLATHSVRSTDEGFDGLATPMRAEAMPLIGEAVERLLPENVQGIGGLTPGADPIAVATAFHCCNTPDRSLSPSEIEAWLLANYWTMARRDDSWTSFFKYKDGDRVEVRVPQRAAPDYPMAVEALLMGIAAFYGQTSANLRADIRAPYLLNAFSVRNGPKDHGTGRWIEGPVKAGDRVVVVDDVPGASTVHAIERCREERLVVAAVVVLVDFEAGGMAAIQKIAGDVPVRAIVTRAQIVAERKPWWMADE